MTITKRVQSELWQANRVGGGPSTPVPAAGSRVRPPLVSPLPMRPSVLDTSDLSESNKGKAWTSDEHARFMEALALYPSGPWKLIARHIGSKTPRQTMTHAQKYRQKQERQQRTWWKQKTAQTPPHQRASAAAAAVAARGNETPVSRAASMMNIITLHSPSQAGVHAHHTLPLQPSFNHIEPLGEPITFRPNIEPECIEMSPDLHSFLLDLPLLDDDDDYEEDDQLQMRHSAPCASTMWALI